MTRVLVKVIRKIGRRGLRYTVKWAWYQACEVYHEWSWGIDTAGWRDWRERWKSLAVDRQCHYYEPLYYTCIDDFLLPLEIEAGKDVFLDYGSGKGRIVLVAAARPFARVIGVEMMAELNTIAEENLRKVKKSLKCKNVEFVTANATTYSVPPDVTVIFIFNSFMGAVLRAVQEQIRASLEEHPRKLTLVYMNPRRDTDTFADCDWLVRKRLLPTRLRDEMRLVVYESVCVPAAEQCRS